MWDSDGQVLATRSIVHDDISIAFIGEAPAAFEVVKTGLEIGLQHVILEGDSLAVIKKCSTD